EGGELTDEGLGLAIGDLEALHHRELARRDLGRHRGAQGLAAHGPRHRLLVAARRGAEGLAAALPLGGPDRALPCTSRPLLTPRLLAAARDLAASPRVVGTNAAVSQFARHRLVHQGPAHLHA